MTDDLTLGTLTVSCKDGTSVSYQNSSDESINFLLKTVEFLVHGIGEEVEHSELLDIDEVKELITYLEAWCNKVETPTIRQKGWIKANIPCARCGHRPGAEVHTCIPPVDGG